MAPPVPLNMADEDEEVIYEEIRPEDIEMLEMVGSGMTAEVFRATWRGHQVAVKEIQWHKSSLAQKQSKAFERELGLLPNINHPNVIRFYGAQTEVKPFRVVMEYCDGGALFELLHNSDHLDIDWSQKRKMCADVASAMDYLHNMTPQIIHRDLKSLNLLLSEQFLGDPSEVPIVKVTDFGLSRMKESEGPWDNPTKCVGTCHWMAPEVYQGLQYDEKVDVYSYAMILFEIVCREIPFEDEEPAQVGFLVVQGRRPDLDAIPLDCPPELFNLMERCWSQEAKDRPPFSEVCQVLASLNLP